MEKIVTKIGDVTIKRRVSKPKVSTEMDTSFGSNMEQTNPASKLSSSTVKTNEIGKLNDLTHSGFGAELTILKKNSVQLDSKNINSVPTLEANSDNSNDEPAEQIPATCNSQGSSENISQIETDQSVGSNLSVRSNETEILKMSEMKESGESLPKVPKIVNHQKQSFSVKSNQEPDLSKLVGISIERKRRINNENQTGNSNETDLQQTQSVKPSVSIQRILSKEQNLLSSVDCKIKEELSGEDSFDDEDTKPSDEFKSRNNSTEIQNDLALQKEFDEVQCKMELQEEAMGKIKTEELGLIQGEESEPLDEEGTPIKNEEQDQEPENGEEAEDDPEAKNSDINDFACTDLVELMKKGEIEGEIEDVKDEEIEVAGENKTTKRKAESTDESEDEEEEGGEDDEKEEEGEEKKKVKKKRKKRKGSKKEGEGGDEKDEDGDDKNIDKSKVTNANLRKNIREVMDETKLDEATLAAQRQEAERLKRLQEQQRIIREVQRQIALNRQNQKSQNKVLSLLQGNSQTSILKTSSIATQVQNSQSKTQNSVLVKLSNGEQTSLNNKKMIELLKSSKNKTILGKPPIPKTLFKQGMVTPSVSIAPVAKKEPTVVDDKKKKKGDVVTLSSDSEDDCIVLSDEDESEPEEDPTNSGMHTNDKYNLPDEKGRIIVNVGHPEAEMDLFLAPQIAKIIKPHQIGGIRFLYDNVIESIDRFSTSAGFGCILAHSMGLGKTLQIVSFSDIFLRYTSAKTILCIMPINTVQNWLAEFNMWLPKESTSEDVRCREFDLYIVNESLKNIKSRAKVILDWQKSGGVLLMGYELFRLLSLKKSYKSKKKKKDAEEDDARTKELIEEVYSALVVPGPDLVICDEGHRIKNSHATTSQALKQIKTKRRIVLTGYPLQNNLLEYWCMVDFVRPNYLGTKTEFSNMFERPIQNGQCIDSTPQDKRLMRYRAHVLHSLLEGFVQRRSHAVLQSTLPEKEEYVLLLRFTPFQRKLYDTFMNEVVRTVAVPNPLKAFAVCCKIWNHPDVLYNFLKKKGEEIDLDLEEALPPSLQIPQYPYGQQNLGFDGANQQVPPWPKRGPGSRGGKIRQSNARKVARGRKPAATIPPNITGEQEKLNDSYNSGQFQQSENFPGQQKSNIEGFQSRNFNQGQFRFGNEYDNSSAAYGNSNFNKNVSDMPGGNFQSKRFFPDSGESNRANQVHGYGNPNRNYETGQQEATTFNQGNSAESNLNTSFESSLNTNGSTYNQAEITKNFGFNQEFNSEFFPAGSYQTPGGTSAYTRDNKVSMFQSNQTYFQNQNFNYQSGNSMNPNFSGYDRRNNSNFQNSGSTPGFQSSIQRQSNNPTGSGGQVPGFQQTNNYQDSNSGSNSNFSSSFQSSESNFEGNRFGQNVNSNFPGNNTSFDVNHSKIFQGQNPEVNFQGNSTNFEVNRNKNFQQGQNPEGNFQGGNYDQSYWSQSQNWAYSDASKASQDFRGNASGPDFMSQQKFSSFSEGQDTKSEVKDFETGGKTGAMYTKMNCDYSTSFEKAETESKVTGSEFEESKGAEPKDEEEKKEEAKPSELPKKEDTSLPYDWAMDLFKTYVTGIIENSSKMEVFFHIVTESIKLGDRLLVFSQSLLTLDLIESYLHRQNVPNKDEVWAKSRNYFRLDGSTPGLEREKLINEFNSNPNIHLFLVSTRAGSLGINLVGANRVVVFDASWNPCHDTQAVCRVYRYGQSKPCYVYRLVMDSCLEKKIYDRQVNKQGMADRVVDELNPDAHLSIKEVTNLCWDDQEDTTVRDYSHLKDKYNDEIIKMLLDRCSKVLSKEPFQHESLLIDRKEKKLSQAEKRLAKRSYELEKQAANQPKNMYSFFPNTGQRNFVKPIASVRPMQSEMNSRIPSQVQSRSKWIPADVWQKQGMSAQEMTLPLDVVIPTSSPEKTSIVLKAGQRVMVLKSPKGIYMQLENGKIIAIRSAFKVGQNNQSSGDKHDDVKKAGSTLMSSSLKSGISVTSKISPIVRPGVTKQPYAKPFIKLPEKKVSVNMSMARPRQVLGKAKPFVLNKKFESITPDVKQRLINTKVGFNNQEDGQKLNSGESATVEEKVNTMEGTIKENNTSKTEITNKFEEKTEEKPEEKYEMADSLETLRKVTEKISDSAKRQDTEPEDTTFEQMNPLKNFRQNFTSQMKGNPAPITDEKIPEPGDGPAKDVKPESGNQVTQQQQGTESTQNWFVNQSYPPVDSYGNYFPGYMPMAYGQGPTPMMPPYDGFYPSHNYGHQISRNASMTPTTPKIPQDSTKTNPQVPVQPVATNPVVHNTQTLTPKRNSSSVVNTSPIYPTYPNPYPYHYNYPTNSSFNNQGFTPFCNQTNQTPQQTIQNPPPTTNTTSSSAASSSQAQQPPAYDNSMYSAFHRPDVPFQTPENSYPAAPYPRPPYSNSGTPSFFPYNPPYPNYPYRHNFNPYMHPSGYGYPMQNLPPGVGSSAGQTMVENGVSNGATNNSGATSNSS
ncbi:hypothetical protein RUM43_008050 [Polyplax serrata]|uniref:Helicase ARIP4 n=1 Tax=Polyplax serrata TaxID=468196 RepID=A0AAN8P6I7_POLSC